jgi:proteasome activator subunit 4
VTSVARALVKSDGLYPAGKSHVLPLLQLILPGIDPNDFRKAMVSQRLLMIYMTFVYSVVDLSTIFIITIDFIYLSDN